MANSAWAAADPPTDLESAERLLLSLPSSKSQVFTGARGLERAFAFLRELGEPQEALRVVHVAGTAGKGSVAYGIAAALRAHGHAVGLHVSPHVYDLRERFQHSGRPAEENEVVVATVAALEAGTRLSRTEYGPPTFFETTTGMAFSLFRQWGVDYAVVEVGLGGLLDGTNTIRRPDKLAVVTSIGLDHTAVLGETYAEIAAQKAGIFPFGGAALVAEPDRADVLEAFVQMATARATTLTRVPPTDAYDGPLHVRSNLALVEEAVRALARRDGWEADVTLGRRAALEQRLPGRMERLVTSDGRVAVLDGAHNPMKAAALVDSLRHAFDDRFRAKWVVGCKERKDAIGLIAELVPHADALTATEFRIPSGDSPPGPSMPAPLLATIAREAGVPDVVTIAHAGDAVAAVTDAPLAVVTGSFLYLAEAKRRLLLAGYVESA